MLLAAPVPNPGPIGPYGTMPWLRAMVPRFANGEAHARRRELVEALLADMDPMALREDAAAMARCAGERQSSGTMREAVDVRAIETPYLPVAVLARRLGVPPARLADAVAATRVVAAAYQPHTAHPDAGAALTRLLALLPGGPEEVVAARICILVQGCEATAGLVRGEDVPVPVTRRVGHDGETILVELADCPFGAGPRRCPGEAHARALAEALR